LDEDSDDIQFIDTKNFEMNVKNSAFPSVTVIMFKNMDITMKAAIMLPPISMFVEEIFFLLFFFSRPLIEM